MFCFVPLAITPMRQHCPRSDRVQTLLILLIRHSLIWVPSRLFRGQRLFHCARVSCRVALDE